MGNKESRPDNSLREAGHNHPESLARLDHIFTESRRFAEEHFRTLDENTRLKAEVSHLKAEVESLRQQQSVLERQLLDFRQKHFAQRYENALIPETARHPNDGVASQQKPASSYVVSYSSAVHGSLSTLPVQFFTMLEEAMKNILGSTITVRFHETDSEARSIVAHSAQEETDGKHMHIVFMRKLGRVDPHYVHSLFTHASPGTLRILVVCHLVSSANRDAREPYISKELAQWDIRHFDVVTVEEQLCSNRQNTLELSSIADIVAKHFSINVAP
jgi:cell division septum initiation protein DivIVA